MPVPLFSLSFQSWFIKAADLSRNLILLVPLKNFILLKIWTENMRNSVQLGDHVLSRWVSSDKAHQQKCASLFAVRVCHYVQRMERKDSYVHKFIYLVVYWLTILQILM